MQGGAGGEKDDIIVTGDELGERSVAEEWEADGEPAAVPEGGTEKMEIMLEDGLELTVEMDSGEKLLNELGYKQELRRNLVRERAGVQAGTEAKPGKRESWATSRS